MAIQITHKEQQASGSFAEGAILENKPIGFPQDGGTQQPYSNLFYWANAWSANGGLIGEHPHKMFEIMSFVIEGEIEHYDSKLNGWLTLSKGDAQIIRSGNGITHAEKINKGSSMFQVWFDPNIQKTMNQPASYNDYKSEDIHCFNENGIEFKNYVGNGGPVKMDSEGVEINELLIPTGNHRLEIDKTKIHSFYLIDGELSIDGKGILEHDFIIVEYENEIKIVANKNVQLFSIAVPKQLSYKTYTQIVNN